MHAREKIVTCNTSQSVHTATTCLLLHHSYYQLCSRASSDQYMDGIALIDELRLRLRERAKNRRRWRYRDLVAVITQFEQENRPYHLDFVVENQRGLNALGLPMFSLKLLLPLVDPAPYERVGGGRVPVIHHNLAYYPLPDPTWEWRWPQWYVLMLDDVDDQGWLYARLVFSRLGNWKGRCYPGNCIRRRIWIRMRVKTAD